MTKGHTGVGQLGREEKRRSKEQRAKLGMPLASNRMLARLNKQDFASFWQAPETLRRIRDCTAVGMTINEIAMTLQTHPARLNEAKNRYPDVDLALSVGAVNLKESLRRAQVKLALEGHAGMLIWLGKQYLEQSDRLETRSEVEVNHVLQSALEEMRAMNAQDVLRIKSIIDGTCEDVTPGGEASDEGEA